MPIYEYVCRSCGHEMEVLQKMSDPLLTDCPECNKPELSKKISAAGFRLTGGGWYETDFKNSGKKKNLAGGDDKSSAKSDTKSDAKSSSSSTGGDSGTKSSSNSNSSAT